MNQHRIFVFLLAHFLLVGIAVSQTNSSKIDFDKARTLLKKQQAGQTLTADERAWLERAKKKRRQQQRSRGKALNQRKAPERLIPLTDMTASDRYGGEDGGLYGAGLNTPPAKLLQAAEAAAATVQPRDVDGTLSPDGRIGFVSISMSNATQEYSAFKKLADQHPEKSSKVRIVDCAQGGQAMAQWVPVDGRPWREALRRLDAAGVHPNQVQVAWVKLANVAPGGSLREHGRQLESDTIKVLQNAKAKFPNLQIAYLGSRIWAGNATGRLNPEPYAYESAFAVRWLIQRQIRGAAELSPEKSPLLLWGPYLWAEGEKGRKTDDLVWVHNDFSGDGVHPSTSGRRKVAELLLKFVTSDRLARSWFVETNKAE